MSETPIYDQLLLEDGPPMVHTWEADADGVIEVVSEPRFVTQFEAAFAHDSLTAVDRLEVQKAVEERVAEWWLAPSPVPPTMHEHYHRPAPRLLPQLPWFRNALATAHA